MTTTTPEAVQEMLDREAVRDVMLRYASGLDRHDYAAVAACFAEDARADYDGLVLGPGVDKIMGFISKAAPNFKRTMHFVGNQLVHMGKGVAGMETYLISHMVVERQGKPHILVRGVQYKDKLVKRNGRWVILERVHTSHWMQEHPVQLDPGLPKEAGFPPSKA